VRPQLQQTQANSQTSQSLSLLTELHPFVQVIDAFSAIPIPGPPNYNSSLQSQQTLKILFIGQEFTIQHKHLKFKK